MSMREQILKRVGEDLLNFRVGNGYELDYVNFVKGNDIDAKNFPTVCYDLSNETSEQIGESIYQQKKSTDLIFIVYVSEYKDKNKGRIVDIREQAINDLNKFIMRSASIAGYNTDAWKVLRLDLITTATTSGQGRLYNYRITNIQHNTNYAEGKATIEFTVSLNYLDFSDEINNTSI